jgi:hypothetical protein
MQKLAKTIATDLDREGRSAVYLSEMARVWPDRKTREKKNDAVCSPSSLATALL